MELNPLSDDFVDELFAPPVREPKIQTVCRECKYHLDRDGYCTRYDCRLYRTEVQADFHCDYCGACNIPNKCVKSVTCPLCFRVPGYMCVNSEGLPQGSHMERFKENRRVHGRTGD